LPLAQTQAIHLAHDQNAFAFDFAGIHNSHPERNQHLFKLEGYDHSWRTAGLERRAAYFQVPPGDYVLRLKVMSSNGVAAEKKLSLFIHPPFWRTRWFYALSLLTLVGLVYAGFRYRIAQVRREEQLLRKEEQLLREQEQQQATFQKKLSEMEMQALRAQMNPHFIFNCLNSINGFILENDPDAASDYLTKFSRLIRLILQNSNAPTVTLENELEALELYLEMEALRFENKFTFLIHCAEEVDAKYVDIPPLLIQPYVENAIWHGLLHKEGLGNITIHLQQAGDVLLCTIEDDGIGRKRAAELKEDSFISFHCCTSLVALTIHSTQLSIRPFLLIIHCRWASLCFRLTLGKERNQLAVERIACKAEVDKNTFRMLQEMTCTVTE
jgi:hypothetical protein